MKSLHALAFGAVFLFGAATSHAQATRPFVLLPKTEASGIARLCSRIAPTKIDGSWEPSKTDIAILESRIHEIASVSGWRQEIMGDPRTYYRQYVAIIFQGRKLIYINALCSEPPAWRKQFANACDGGTCFWGVLYDPSKGQFFELHTNGRA